MRACVRACVRACTYFPLANAVLQLSSLVNLGLLRCQIGASHYWLRKGCPKNKLVIGLAGFGRTFTLTSPAAYRLNAPAKHPGEEGTYTREKGMMSYYEVICPFKNTRCFTNTYCGGVSSLSGRAAVNGRGTTQPTAIIICTRTSA